MTIRRDVHLELVTALRRAERAEVELAHLRRWKAEALPIIEGLQELGQALAAAAITLRAQINDGEDS